MTSFLVLQSHASKIALYECIPANITGYNEKPTKNTKCNTGIMKLYGCWENQLTTGLFDLVLYRHNLTILY